MELRSGKEADPEERMLKESAERLMISVEDALILYNEGDDGRKLLCSMTPQKELPALLQKHKPKRSQIYEVLRECEVNLFIKGLKPMMSEKASLRIKQASDEASPCWKEIAADEERRRQDLLPPDKEAEFLEGRKHVYMNHAVWTDYVLDDVTALWRRAKLCNKEPKFKYILFTACRFEVFQLIIHTDCPVELYGQVIVNEESILYSRTCDNPEKISPTDNCALLIDPVIGIDIDKVKPWDEFDTYAAKIQVELMDKLSGHTSNGCIPIRYCDPDDSDDDDCGNIKPVTISTDGYDGGTINWNQPVHGKFYSTSPSFSATLTYAMLLTALKADVQVRLALKPNYNSPANANVYGLISGTSYVDSPSKSVKSPERTATTMTLFKKSRNECMQVKPYGFVPLSRSSVAVRERSSFKVYIKLMNFYPDLSLDDEIVNGVADFFPICSRCTSRQYIIGKYGEVQVTVNLY